MNSRDIYRFIVTQLVTLPFVALGWLLLIPFCHARAWTASERPSIKDGRTIDRWRWAPLNLVYGNPEDGVSGKTALYDGGKPYLPDASPEWRAYSWSALRNSANGLKYICARTDRTDGPLVTRDYDLFGRWYLHTKIGWQQECGHNVPVFLCKLKRR